MTIDNPENNLRNSPVHLLHRAGQCAGGIFHSTCPLEDLTPRQYAVLLTISQNEGLSQTDLVDATGIDRSTLADIARRLLTKGLLQRQRTKEDARVYSVKLTEAGWKVLKAAQPAMALVDQRILSVLPQGQRDGFLSSLHMIVQSMSEDGLKNVKGE